MTKVEGFVIVLEDLPLSFGEERLAALIGPPTAIKSKVIGARFGTNEAGTSAWAEVTIDRKEETNALLARWDQVVVEGKTIRAWAAHMHPQRQLPSALPSSKQTQPQSQPQAPQQSSPQPQPAEGAYTGPAGNASLNMTYTQAARYPFGAMQTNWLTAYVNSLRNPDRSYTMCRVLECLMRTAVTNNDPYMEYAVVQFYTKFTVNAWQKAQNLMDESAGVTFELCRQVFEVLGLVRKYPTANAKSRKMLITLVERLVEDINGVSSRPSQSVLDTARAIPETTKTIRQHIAALKEDPNSEESLRNLISWMKFLFSCLLSHQNDVPAFPEQSTTYHCSEECECFAKARARFTSFICDVEKAKVIDCLIITAVRQGDDYAEHIAEDLLQRYPPQFCARAIRGLQNAELTLLRFRMFAVSRAARRINQIQWGASRRQCDTIESTLLIVKEFVQDHADLQSLVLLIDSALVCLYDLRTSSEGSTATAQKQYRLQFDLNQIFIALCVPAYHLCAHTDTTGTKSAPVAGRRPTPVDALVNTPPHCANPQCPGTSQELLKCSGCKVSYYCSVGCQKVDWKVHRVLCREMSNRGKEMNSVVPSSIVPAEPAAELRVLRPAFLATIAAR